MAKKRAAKRRTTSRRRRTIGAINKGLIMEAAGVIGGLIAGDMLQSKVAPTIDPKIKGGVTIALGVFLVPKILKNDLGKGLALGLAGSGGLSILKSFGVINGIGVRQLPYQSQNLLNGRGDGINAMVNGRDGISAMVNGSQRPAKRSAMQTALKYS